MNDKILFQNHPQKKSKEEIELITEPEYKINMIANAVAIRDN